MNRFIVIVFFLLSSLSYANELEQAVAKTKADIKEARLQIDAQSKKFLEEKIQLNKKLSALRQKIKSLKSYYAELKVDANDGQSDLEELKSEIKNFDKTLDFIYGTNLEFRRAFETRLNTEQATIYGQEFKSIDQNLQAEEAAQKLKALKSLLDLSSKHNNEQFGGSKYKLKVISQDNALIEGYAAQFGPFKFFSSDHQSGMLIDEQGLDQARLYDNFTETEKASIKALVETGKGELPIDISRGIALKLKETERSIWQTLTDGGLTMYPLIILALFCVIIAIYKFISINLYKVKHAESNIQKILNALKENRQDDALAITDQMGLPLGPVLKVGIRHRNASREHIEELMYERVLIMIPRLEKLLTPLAVAASAAPLLGLLGTVTGMIHTFSLIQVHGTGDASLLSSGIAEALITTMVGLIIAVPALLMHAYLSGRVKKAVNTTQQSAIMFVNGLTLNEADMQLPKEQPKELSGESVK